MADRPEEGRTVWVRLIDVPLAKRLYYARVLRERELAEMLRRDERASLTSLERALDYDRAARAPNPAVGLWVSAERAEKVLRG